MKADDKLPEDLLWRDDGHVSDVVVTALADGESSLVADAAAAHVDSCSHCSERLADAVWLSMSIDSVLSPQGALAPDTAAAPDTALARPSTGEAKAAAAPHVAGSQELAQAAKHGLQVSALNGTEANPMTLRFPRVAAILALAVAAVGALPSLSNAPDVLTTLSKLAHTLPMLVRSVIVAVPAVVDQASRGLTMVSLAAGMLMILGGFLIARRMPREMLKGQLS